MTTSSNRMAVLFPRLTREQQEWLLIRYLDRNPPREHDSEATAFLAEKWGDKPATLERQVLRWRDKPEFKEVETAIRAGLTMLDVKAIIRAFRVANGMAAILEETRLVHTPWSELRSREDREAKLRALRSTLEYIEDTEDVVEKPRTLDDFYKEHPTTLLDQLEGDEDEPAK